MASVDATSKNKITVTVVVSGAPQTVAINTHERVEHLMREALKEAGIRHPDLSEWALRKQEGGDPIPPQEKIEAAGIADGSTLFLDPDEGGGGEAAAPPDRGTTPLAPVLVDPAISKAKLARELEQWHANVEVYNERGCILLDSGDLYAEVAFTTRLPIGAQQDLTAIPLAVRFDFENYDLWPPSVKLIDPVTRRWLEAPRLAAVDFAHRDRDGDAQNAFIGGHPDTGRVFLCKRGVREYHSHPEHSGDDWLLYRGKGIGTLGQLCEVLWRLTTRTVTGMQFVARRVQVDQLTAVTQAFELRQENVDELAAQMRTQIAPVQFPPEIQAQLQAAAAQAQR